MEMVKVNPMPEEGIPHEFEYKEYDITDQGCQCCLALTFPLHLCHSYQALWARKKLTLEAEEAVFKVECCVCNQETRRPYGELGSVDESNTCGCIGVASGLTKSMPICPGMGCESALVSEIVRELKARMKQRGDTGQIQRQEVLLNEVRSLKAELLDTKEAVRLLCDPSKIPLPAPTASVMVR